MTQIGPGKRQPPRAKPTISPDGKWRSFPKVQNLLQYVSTGTFYGRVKVDGKLYRDSLETHVFSTAKLKLSDFVRAKMRKRRQVGTPVRLVARFTIVPKPASPLSPEWIN